MPPVDICFDCRRGNRPAGDREAGFACGNSSHRQRGRAALWMEHPLDHLVHQFKYGDRASLARPLARLMIGSIPDPGGDLVTAVPLHPVRRRERGYNQAALLARLLAEAWGIPFVEEVAMRRRSTRVQARVIEADRARNVAGAFAVPLSSWVQGRSLIAVDDVATTGSTLGEVGDALLAAGAVRVVPVVLALA